MSTNNRKYVYLHKDDGVIVYVGSGTGGRAWSCKGTDRRNPDHKEWIENCILDGIDFVQIVGTRMSESDARELEKRLITAHQPRFNIEGTEKGLINQRKRMEAAKTVHYRKVLAGGIEFPSVVEAAAYHTCHPKTIDYRIAVGKPGYKYLEPSTHWRSKEKQ